MGRAGPGGEPDVRAGGLGRPEAAVRWAQHMSDSIVELQLPEAAERAMLEYVVRFTPSMINHAG